MKKLACIALLVLAGCASEPPQNQAAIRDSARIHTELGAGYYAQNQMGIALEEFNEAVRIDPSYSLAYNGLGLVYSALKEDTKADANFKRSIQLDPANSESRNNYGTFLCSRNRIDESIVQFMEALKNPLYITPGIAYMNAGICSLRKNDAVNGEMYLLKAVEAQPLLNQASYQLALINFNRANYNVAREYLRTPLNNEPTAEMLWLAIKVERFLGGRDNEATYALQLRKKFPNSEQTKALLAGQ